jgi:hypothetical protein
MLRPFLLGLPIGLILAVTACGSSETVPLGNGDSQRGGTSGKAGSAGKGGTSGSGGSASVSEAGIGWSDGGTLVDGGSIALRWYSTCGDPVCSAPMPTPNAGVPACGSIQEGDACTEENATCDPGAGCGVLLRCAAKPIDTSNCPISSQKHKQDIEYLNESDLEKLAVLVQKIKLATYHYKDQPTAEQKHLGFIIEDNPKSPAVFTHRERVDLYGYASMAVAAVQVQQKQIRALEKQIAELRTELARRGATASKNDKLPKAR